MLHIFEFDYDKDNDILFLFDKKSKSRHSIRLSNEIFFDLDNKDQLAGLELRNASELLTNISGKKISPDDLETISKTKLQIQEIGGLAFIKIHLTLLKNGEEEEIPATITVPTKQKTAKIFA